MKKQTMKRQTTSHSAATPHRPHPSTPPLPCPTSTAREDNLPFRWPSKLPPNHPLCTHLDNKHHTKHNNKDIKHMGNLRTHISHRKNPSHLPRTIFDILPYPPGSIHTCSTAPSLPCPPILPLPCPPPIPPPLQRQLPIQLRIHPDKLSQISRRDRSGGAALV